MTEPTGFTAVGMVGFTDKGTYSASASYVKNDLVHYGGSIWCCLIDDTTGITPTEGTNWTLFVGEPTNMAERIIAPLEVSPSENAYSIGEQLIFNDALYKAKTAIAVGDALVVDTNIELAPKISSQIQTLTNNVSHVSQKVSNNSDSYDSTKAYAVGEHCIYNNVLYKCITACSAAAWSVNQNCFSATTLTDAVTDLNNDLSANKGYVKDINITVNANSTASIPVSSLFDSEGLYFISFVFDDTGLARQNAPIAIVRVYNNKRNIITYFKASGQWYWDGLVTIENGLNETTTNLVIKNAATEQAWTATKMSLKPLEVR